MKKTEYRGVWESFFQMLYKSNLPYGLMILTLLISMMNSWVGLQLPDMVASLVNSVTHGGMMSIFLMGMAQLVLTIGALISKTYAQILIDRNMQRQMADKIFYLKMSDIEKRDPREMVSRVTTDTKLLSALLLTITVDELPRLYYMVGALVKIYRNYDTTLGIVLLVSVPVTLLGSWIVGKLTFGKAEALQAAISRLTARIGEKVNNMSVIKSYNSQEKESESGEQVILDLEKNLRKKAVIDRIGATATTLVTLIPTVAVISVGAALVLSGKVETVTFVAYYGLAGTFIGHVVAHMTLWISIKNAQGATWRISQILRQPDELVEETRSGQEGSISFVDVCKSFGDNKVLDHVSFTLEAGKKTALVGYSGSGKSTVLNLLEQFYRPDSGEILMGGVPVTEWDIQSYRNNFTYVPQNAPGFSGTIRELLTYGEEAQLSDEELWKVVDQVGARAFVELLGGLDYEVGNNAEKLSGGQKQKLCIARAMTRPKEIMLLDEATSALDVKATEQIQSLLDQLMLGKTMILVAHNLATVKNADKIIVFDEGRVIAEGTHQELMAGCAHYRELAAATGGREA